MTLQISISPHLTSPVGNPSWPSPREGTSYSANQHQPPPSLPRRGGTDTLDCQWLIRLGVTCISPTGENERGLMMITGETYSYSRHQPPLNHISPYLTSPVGNPSWPSPREGTSYSANQHQPPPSLPRRGGTDTLDCLTVNGLSD